MIKVLFPPGCYGTYLARCIYAYSTLNINPSSLSLNFDLSGSSHIFRTNTDAKTKIWQGHLSSPDWSVSENDQVIILLPLKQHYLDYYNNQFYKQYNKDIVRFISVQFSTNELSYKLKKHWEYHLPFSADVPRWILRELFSMLIQNCLTNAYAPEKYSNIPNKIVINTQDIILNFENTFDLICTAIDLKKTVDIKTIRKNHQTFLSLQHYCNIQLYCDQWVDAVIEGNEQQSPCKTIFDEAYIQHRLRVKGYEIKCQDLNHFPVSSSTMRSFYIQSL